MRIPTVAIVKPNGDRRIINLSDYDPEVHTLWEDRDPPLDPALGTEETPEAPTDPEERLAAIRKAIAQLGPENPEHYGKSGKPHVEAIEAILGWNITAAERDAALEG